MAGYRPGLEALLLLDESIFEQDGGFWVKIEARLVESSTDVPHGVRYNLTLHDRYGTRVLGYDNAHGVKPPKRGFRGRRLPYDHRHRTARDKGVPYVFESAEKLLADFFREVDKVIRAATEEA
jgi:Family of unknown function (DUF6516)